MRVFVSHAGRDRAWAEWVAWQLEHSGREITAELDCWDWQAGDNLVARMSTALASCDHMLAICSQAYYEPARWTTDEWTAALHRAKERHGFLIPVRIDDTPAPPLLATLYAPRLHGLERDRARAALLGMLGPAGRPEHEPPHPDTNLRETGPRLPGMLPAVWGPLPGPNEAFTGRDAMLLRLRDGLRGSGRAAVYALSGAGGVGKTQLGAEYAWRFAGDYEAVWWVNAEQADRIGEQYAAFAYSWCLIDSATPVEDAVEVLRAQCRRHDRWLIVLDNARSARDVAPWRLAGPGHMLITSRDPHWPEIATTVPVDVFARSESIALLRAYVPALADSDADGLAHALADLPLALTQAASVLVETGMPPAEYLGLLDRTPAEVLDEGAPISYPRSLARSIRLAMAQLTRADPSAAQLLKLCAFLAPEPIPTGWFLDARADVLPEPLASTVTARLAYRRTLGRLTRFGLAKLANDRLAVHRLTQRLLRADTPDPDITTATVGAVLASLTLGEPDDPGTWLAWADLLPHLRVLDLAATNDVRLAGQACQAALYLLRRGEVQASYAMIDPLHQTWCERLGPTALPVLWSANPLGQALGALGQLREAVVLGRELLDRYRVMHGYDHIETLTSASNLANRLAALGEYEQARALNEDTLARRRRVLGDDHPHTLASAQILARDLSALGEYEEARALNEDTLARRRRVLGDDHPHTLASANNFAANLAALGDDEHARALAEDTLARYRRVLGDDHPDTLASAHNLAVDLAALGEPEQARALAEGTLTRRRRVLGDDHADTAMAAKFLAWLDRRNPPPA